MSKFETENDLKLTIKAGGKEVLVEETCCTSINILLKNDGQIMTSFLGAHNPEIIKNLERALKLYFKGIKKTLKTKYVETDCCCGDNDCHGESHDHECKCGGDCHCHDEKHNHDKDDYHKHGAEHSHCDHHKKEKAEMPVKKKTTTKNSSSTKTSKGNKANKK